MSARVAEQPSATERIAGVLVVTAGILITVLISWLVPRSSRRMVERIGPAGIDAVTRLLGFILICIGVEFASAGVMASSPPSREC